jgi:hypothetical protein
MVRPRRNVDLGPEAGPGPKSGPFRYRPGWGGGNFGDAYPQKENWMPSSDPAWIDRLRALAGV